MIIKLPGPERSLPTSIQYRSERITAFQAPDLDANGLTPKEILERIQSWRTLQFQDLDVQEALLRTRFEMPVPKAAAPAPSSPSKETLAEVARLRKRLADLTEQPVEREPTPTEADAQRLLKQLRIALFDLEAKGRA